MKRTIYLIFFVSAINTPVFAQQLDCNNIGFEQGTTTGWLLTNGQVANVGQQVVFRQETVGTLENGHRITSLSDGNDPKITSEAIPMVAPGSTHSIRIGNVTRGSRFDRIKGSYVVTSDNTLFQYKLAVILQNANHEAPLANPVAGWDGTYQGQLVLSGVYLYKLQVELHNGDLTHYTGVINLVR